MTWPADLGPTRLALATALETLRADREHGASWLARLVARSLRDAATTTDTPSNATRAQLLDLLHTAARDFATARPSMAAVANAAASVWAAAATATDRRSALPRLRDEAARIVDGEETWSPAIRDALRPLLTGPLVTLSRSGTVERALIDLLPDLPDASREIAIGESRPGGEGIASARALAAHGWRVTLLADAALGSYVTRAALVLVGADSIRPDGALVNKVGTYLLALAARDARLPFYAVCETLKIAASGFPLALEEMDPVELLPDPIPGVTARNPYFDVTPARLVTGVVTERGLLTPPAIAQASERAAAALTALDRPIPPA